MDILRAAIEEKALYSDIYNDVSGRFYYRRAESDDYPRVIFYRVSSIPDNAFAKTGESVLVQFDLFSMASAGKTEIETMETHLKSLYDDCTLTLSSNTLVGFRRTNTVGPMDEELDALPDGSTTIYHTVVEYEATYQS
jgi:hypothetical protein